jgi:hypothetical protein
MAAKGSVSVVEQHIEKGLLGLGVLFLLFLGVRYFVMEPHTIEFENKQIGPRELEQALVQKADNLRRTIATKEPSEEKVQSFVTQLEEQFTKPIWEDKAAAVPETVVVAGGYGKATPQVSESGGVEHISAIITPLPPVSLATRTGISVVQRVATRALDEDPTAAAAAPAADDDNEPVETPWVVVGGYTDTEAQQKEMTKAGYPAHRSRVAITGIEAQRQELLPNGEWGQWEDVPRSKAMPHVDVPEPAFDGQGELLNLERLEQSFTVVKQVQGRLMQPPFFVVEAGDKWEPPPLPGHDEEEIPDWITKQVEDEFKQEKPDPKDKEKRAAPTPPPAGAMPPPMPGGMPGGRGGMPGGRGGAPPMGPGRGMPQPSPTAGVNPGPRNDGDKEGKKFVREALDTARKAAAKRQWAEAVNAAGQVENHQAATKAQKNTARALRKDARLNQLIDEWKLSKQSSEPGAVSLVKNPKSKTQTAVWVHDDSVQPGKTYRYRLRVKLWNRYVGRPSVLPAEYKDKAKETELQGEWSAPTLPLTVAPKHHFFVARQNNDKSAGVDVFAWHKGKWLKKAFTVKVGDVIGGPAEVQLPPDEDADRDEKSDKPKKEQVDFSTGAVVLDLREEAVMTRVPKGKGEFSYSEKKTTVLVYLDPVDGQVKERSLESDKNDLTYKRLREETEALAAR